MPKKRLYPFLESFKQSLGLFKTKLLLMSIPVLIDLVFLFVLGFVNSFIVIRLMDHLYEVSALLGAADLQSSIMSGSIALLANPEFLAHYKAIIFLIILFLIVVYVLYCLFQSISWKYCHSLTGLTPIPIKRYIQQFFSINLLWFAIFTLINYVSLRALMSIAFSMFPVVSQNTIFVITGIFLAVLGYFTFISYTLIGKYNFKNLIKNSFVLGIKKANNILPMYGLIILGFLILHFILLGISKLSLTATVIVGIFTVLPWITFSRLYLMINLDKIQKH